MTPSAVPTFGRYVLGPRLAAGGMGEVHLATQLGMGEFAKPLVLKLLLPHLASLPRAVEMFLTEARLASRMNHPNVVHIFDVGVIDGRHFIAMELVRGVALSKLLTAMSAARKHLDADLVLYIARCLCDGLHHAHEQRGPDGKPLNLIHRDVTPENVLVGVEGQVKLTDFGVARAADQGPDGRVVGKLGYIAPELFAGHEVDRRADVFSTAVTLFNVAALQRAFHRETRDATLEAVRREPLPNLRALRPDLPPEFAAALDRATHKDPAQRFASARELRDALPAPKNAGAAEELGALVNALCSDQLMTLDMGVEQTVSLRAGTAQLSPSPMPLTKPTVSERPAPKRRVKLFVGVGLLQVAIAGVLLATWPSRPAPQPVVEVAPPAPPAPPVEPPTPVAVEPPPATEFADEPPAPPKKKPTARGRKEVKAAEAPPADPGFVVVDATPWALVSINGKEIGETPIASFPIAPGAAVVTLRNPDTGKQLVRRVNVKQGERAYVKGDLR